MRKVCFTSLPKSHWLYGVYGRWEPSPSGGIKQRVRSRHKEVIHWNRRPPLWNRKCNRQVLSHATWNSALITAQLAEDEMQSSTEKDVGSMLKGSRSRLRISAVVSKFCCLLRIGSSHGARTSFSQDYTCIYTLYTCWALPFNLHYCSQCYSEHGCFLIRILKADIDESRRKASPGSISSEALSSDGARLAKFSGFWHEQKESQLILSRETSNTETWKLFHGRTLNGPTLISFSCGRVWFWRSSQGHWCDHYIWLFQGVSSSYKRLCIGQNKNRWGTTKSW